MRLAALLTLFLAACGGDPLGTARDGGPDAHDAAPDSAPDSALAVSPVAPPSLPAWDCPDTWRTMGADELAPGLTRCEPWPEEEVPCARHEFRLPGDGACHSVGSPCPADGWPADLPETGVVYVRPGASEPADGSRNAPYPDPTTALDALPPGTTTLALSVGEYPERLAVHTSLVVRGACTEETVLTASFAPLVADGAAHITIEDLTFATEMAGAVLLSNTTAVVQRVAFENVVLLSNGPVQEVADVVFRGNGASASTALTLRGETSVTIRRVVVEDFTTDGLYVGGYGSQTVADVYVRRIGGRGLSLLGEAVALDRVALEDVSDVGVSAIGGGVMKDLLVRRVVQQEAIGAAGVLLAGGWDLAGVHVAHVGDVGVVAAEGEFRLRDAILEGLPSIEESRGRGVEVGAGSTFDGQRVIITDTGDLGLLASRRSAVGLTDVTIRGVEERLSGGFGRCVHGQLGAMLSLERVALERCTEVGLSVYGGARATLRDVRVAEISATRCVDVGEGCTGAAGIGVLALTNGIIDAERFIVEDAALAGVIVVEESDVDLRDGTIRNNPIGLNLQATDYSLGRVMDRVVFVDNTRNLDSTALPVPGATAGVN